MTDSNSGGVPTKRIAAIDLGTNSPAFRRGDWEKLVIQPKQDEEVAENIEPRGTRNIEYRSDSPVRPLVLGRAGKKGAWIN